MFANQYSANDSVDIDSYFAAFSLDYTEPSDSNIDDNDLELDAIERMKKPDYFISGFQLPIPFQGSSSKAIEIEAALNEEALERSAYEVQLLSRQLEKIDPIGLQHLHQGSHSAQEHTGSETSFSRIKTSAAILMLTSLILGGSHFYQQFRICIAAESCEWGQQMLAMLPSAASNLAPAPASITEVTAAPSATQELADPFREAVNAATLAAELTQTAKTAEEWSTVADLWLRAISAMNSVSPAHPRRDVAEQRVEDYANNLAYAQNRMRVQSARDDV